MSRQVSLAVTSIAMLFATQFSWAFKPHHEPIVYESSPKPNIYMIIDDSGSMKLNLSGGHVSSPSQGPSRTEVLVPILKEISSEFSSNAYIGLSYLGNGKRSLSAHPNAGGRSIVEYLSEDLPEAKRITNNTHIYYTNMIPVTDLSIPRNKSKFDYIVDKYSDKGIYDIGTAGFVYNNTPLGPAVYNATLYLRNKPLFLAKGPANEDIMYSRPFNLKYRCQDSYILLLSDGQENVSSLKYRAPGDYINVAADLANMAKFAHSLDLRRAAFDKLGTRDQANVPWYGKGSKELPIYMYTIGFALNAGDGIADEDGFRGYMKTLNYASKLAGGRAFEANDKDSLRDAFDTIFRSIIKTKSGASSLTDQYTLTKDAVYYQSFYNPDRWIGEIRAYRYNTANESFNTDGKALWSTEDRITIVADTNQSDPRFLTANATGKQIYLDDSNLAPQYIHWLRGINNHTYNLKKRSPMGDVIGSDIVYHARDRLNINLRTVARPMSNNFEKFLIEKNNRMGPNLIIAGSNDGLLNFIVAEKGRLNTSLKSGDRYAAYFPYAFHSKINAITKPDTEYKHLYTMNGLTNLFDAFVGTLTSSGEIRGHYKTIGMTGMGAGGKGIVGYQLFSMNDDLSTADRDIRINFEISNQSSEYRNLGYTYSNFDFFNQVTSRGEARAVAVFGNGYGSGAGGYVYKMNAMTGKRIGQPIKLPGGIGASTPSLVTERDSAGLQKVKYIYVGDYNGTLYKIDLSKNNTDDLNPTADEVIPYFTSVGKSPITTRPIVARKAGTHWVYFGTGSAMTLEDSTSNAKNYFYGIKVEPGRKPVFSEMQKQAVSSLSKINDDTYYINTSNAVNNNIEKSGWYFDVNSFVGLQGYDFRGERIVKSPSINVAGYINFATWGVRKGRDGDPCDPDSTFGSSITLKLENGNSANADFTSHRSGFASKDKSFGVASGPFMDPYGEFAGGGAGYINRYSSKTIEEILDSKVGAGSHAKREDIIMHGNAEEELQKNQIVTPADDGGAAGNLFLEPVPLEEDRLGRIYYRHI